MRVTCVHKGRESVSEFTKPEIIIGRANAVAPPDLDLMPDITVSRTQARLWMENSVCWIEDLNSRFGTFLNGVRLEHRRALKPGDVVVAGETTIRVDVPALPPGVAAQAVETETTRAKIETAVNAEDSSLAAVAEAGSISRRRLALLLELPLLFGEINCAEDLLQLVIRRTIEVIPGAERGVVLLRGGEELKVMAHHPANETAYSATLARRAMSEGRGFIWRKHNDETPSPTARDLGIMTGMYVPMLWQGRTLGVICVDNPHRDCIFTEHDLQLLFTVARYAAMAHSYQTPRR